MPGSVTSVFSEPDDFQAALREEGALGMLVTGPGRFRARLTQVTLHRLRLLAAEEHLPRIRGTVLLWIFSRTPPSNTGYLHRDLREPDCV
jgi:hypothetical protein